LFSVLSTTYGAGDGSTTFALPDLRGRVPAGKDDMGGSAASRLTSTVLTASNTLGATGGTQTHTLTTAEMPAHVHDQVGRWTTDGSHNHAGIGGGAAEASNPSNANASGMGSVTSTGGGSAHLNTQPTIVLNYIIKAQ
jgi:microcystin-dependent protein